jgi:AraC-like DNA-binding protein/ligand-binding sensor protein
MDSERALAAARSYRLATGVACALIDDRGYSIDGDATGDITPCAVCTHLSGRYGIRPTCRESRLYGSFQALRFGGRYTYFCDHSLTHIAAPLLDDGVMVASFSAGPFLLIDRDEYLRDELLARGRGIAPTPELERAVESIPVVPTDRAHALEELLLYTASWASGVNVRSIVEEEERISSEAHVSGYIHAIKTMGGGSDATEYPAETERRLLETIRLGDRDAARDLLAEILASVRVAAGEEVRTVKARVLELAVLLSRAAIDGGADPQSVFGINFRALEQVHTYRSVAELTHWLTRIADRFVVFVFHARRIGERDVINKALQYMRRHLSERIGLESVAAEVRLSPAYFSRIFKEETGESFTRRCNRLRIDRARELLLSTDDTISGIAVDVGFSDQSHFTRVFKSQTGITPLSFRRTRGRLPTETQEIHE